MHANRAFSRAPRGSAHNSGAPFPRTHRAGRSPAPEGRSTGPCGHQGPSCRRGRGCGRISAQKSKRRAACPPPAHPEAYTGRGRRQGPADGGCGEGAALPRRGGAEGEPAAPTSSSSPGGGGRCRAQSTRAEGEARRHGGSSGTARKGAERRRQAAASR